MKLVDGVKAASLGAACVLGLLACGQDVQPAQQVKAPRQATAPAQATTQQPAAAVDPQQATPAAPPQAPASRRAMTPENAPVLSPGSAPAPERARRPPLPPPTFAPDAPTGTVKERRHTGEYVYLRIDPDDKLAEDVWVAAAVFRGSEGDKVYLPPEDSFKRENFPSQALERTFETLYMVREVYRPGGVPGSVATGPAPPDPQKVAELQEAAQKDGLPGTILEAHHKEQYSYLKVDTGLRQAWVATAPMPQAVVGDTIYVKDGVVMRDFESKALGRTFKEIFFADAPRLEKKAEATP